MHVLFVVAFSFTLSLGAAAGVNMQKLSMNREERLKSATQRPPYLQPLWMMGFGIQVLDAIGDFVCVGLAPQTLLTPIGSLSLGFNVILAPLFHKNETATRRIVSATALIYIGAILTVMFAPETNPNYTLVKVVGLMQAPAAWMLALGCISFQLSLVWHGRRTKGYKLVHYCGLAGCFGGECILFTKSVSELVKNAIVTKQYTDWTTGSPIPYLLVVGMLACVISNVHFLNQALAKFDALLVVPIYQSFWNAFAITGGLVFFQEYQYMTAKDGIMYALGIAITMMGVYFLVTERTGTASTGKPGARGEIQQHNNITKRRMMDDEGTLNVNTTSTKAEEDGLIRHRRVPHGQDQDAQSAV